MHADDHLPTLTSNGRQLNLPHGNLNRGVGTRGARGARAPLLEKVGGTAPLLFWPKAVTIYTKYNTGLYPAGVRTNLFLAAYSGCVNMIYLVAI